MRIKPSNEIKKIAIYSRTEHNINHSGKLHYLIIISLIGVLLTTTTAGAKSSYGQPDSAKPIQSPGNFPNTVFISSSNNTVHELGIKALNTNGQVSKVPGFKIDMAKVALINPSSPNINAFSNDPTLTMTGAKLRTNTQGFDLPGTANTYSLAGLAQGVYTLDIIAQKGNDQGAYETILVIGPTITPPIQNVIQQKIVQETRVDSGPNIDIDFDRKPEKKPDKDIVCLYHPEDSLCKPDSKGDCDSGWGKNEDGQCFPMDEDCPKGYWRADDDESGACVPKETLPAAAAVTQLDESTLPPCDGSFQDCVTENGDVCEAGSTAHECELADDADADAFADFTTGPIVNGGGVDSDVGDGENPDADDGDEQDVEEEEEDEDGDEQDVEEEEEDEDGGADVVEEIEVADEGGEE